jgi:hypothetical protein
MPNVNPGQYSCPLGELVVEAFPGRTSIRFTSRTDGKVVEWLFQPNGKFLSFCCATEAADTNAAHFGYFACKHITDDYTGKVYRLGSKQQLFLCEQCVTIDTQTTVSPKDVAMQAIDLNKVCHIKVKSEVVDC